MCISVVVTVVGEVNGAKKALVVRGISSDF